MNAQPDLFAFGDLASVPPWQDPEQVDRVRIQQTTDRDHVGDAAIGKVGNNRAVDVVEVIGKDGSTLYSETFARFANMRGTTNNSKAAADRAEAIRRLIYANRQGRLI
jgi:hypothetical protein